MQGEDIESGSTALVTKGNTITFSMPLDLWEDRVEAACANEGVGGTRDLGFESGLAAPLQEELSPLH
jgi:hypothetical protein